jgi:uncharacterized protein (TIGR02271 family)
MARRDGRFKQETSHQEGPVNTNGQDPSTVFGENVIDTDGNTIGSVNSVWVDDATNELEFIGVKTGWLFGQTHVIPCADAQFSGDTITVPYSQDQIKDAPSFGADDELSPDDEQEIYTYYGLNRSTTASPSGLSTDDGTTTTDYGSDTSGDTDSVRLHQEELQVGKRQVEAGNVRLRKVVNTEHQEVPVELRSEDVEIERVPVSDATATSDSDVFEEKEINVPVTREEPVVAKEVRTTGEVRLNKNVQTETETVGGDVRSEDVDVADSTDDAGTAYASATRTGTGYTTDDDTNA